MSFIGDVGSFEMFNLGAMGKQVGENPARLFYGSADPFSTGMWNKVLGTNDKPLVDQWGGAAPQRYEEAQEAGINTGPGKSMHGIAKMIASIYAGGAAGNAAGGLLGSGGGGATAGSTAASSAPSAGYGLGQPVVTGQAGSAAYAGGSSPGLLGSMGTTLSNFNAQAKPYMDAASYGQKAYGLLNQGMQPQQMAAHGPAQQNTSGPQTLAQIAQGAPNPLIAQRQQYAQQRRAGMGRT